jgi:uncharacterized membrane protein YhaH (DUF805 family)
VEPAADPPEPSRWPWILWTLTSVAVFSLAGLMSFLTRVATIYYYELEMKYLPLPTEWVLKAKDAFWLLALATAASGLPFARRRDSEKTQRWSLVVLLSIIALGSTIAVALLEPMIKVQTHLSK